VHTLYKKWNENASVKILKEGEFQMVSGKKLSWQRILMALSLVALLGVASCGTHIGGAGGQCEKLAYWGHCSGQHN